MKIILVKSTEFKVGDIIPAIIDNKQKIFRIAGKEIDMFFVEIFNESDQKFEPYTKAYPNNSIWEQRGRLREIRTFNIKDYYVIRETA